MRHRLGSTARVFSRVYIMRRILYVDTQRMRQKMIVRLDQIFEIASEYASCKIDRVADAEGKPRHLTLIERQFWARIATFTAQTINSIAKGLDERQIDRELDKLERMLNQTSATIQVSAANSEPPGKSEGT